MLKLPISPPVVPNLLYVNVAFSPSKREQSYTSCRIINLMEGVKKFVLAAVSTISEKLRLESLNWLQVCNSLFLMLRYLMRLWIPGQQTTDSMQITPVAQPVVSRQNNFKAVVKAQRNGIMNQPYIGKLETKLTTLTSRSQSPSPHRSTIYNAATTSAKLYFIHRKWR